MVQALWFIMLVWRASPSKPAKITTYHKGETHDVRNGKIDAK